MDRITCPACRTEYPFAVLGIAVPQDPTTVTTGRTACAVCRGQFEFTVRWHPVKTVHIDGWWRRNFLGRAPEGRYNYAVHAETRQVPHGR